MGRKSFLVGLFSFGKGFGFFVASVKGVEVAFGNKVGTAFPELVNTFSF